MRLDKKLKEIPLEERGKFLSLKYKELMLIHRVDRITDRHTSVSRLLEKSLQLIIGFFKCRTAAFLLGDGSWRKDQGFFFVTEQPPTEAEKQAVKSLLISFMAEPQVQCLVNEPSAEQKNAGITNHLLIPMIINSEFAGAFFIANREEDFGDRDLHFLRVISSQLDNAVIYARFKEEYKKTTTSLKQRARELNILYEMSLSLGLGYDFETLAQKVLESSMQLVNVDRASLMLYDPKTDDLKTSVICGEKQKIRLVRLGMGKGIAGLALTSGQPVIAPLGSDDERFVPFEFSGIKPRRIYSLLCIPLLDSDKAIGVINFAMLSRKKTFSGKDTETLSVAAHLIAMALQRQQFYQMSIKDELTGLYSFRYFKERLKEEVTRSKRYKMVGSLVIFDLDHFKSVNDTYGHPFGNVVLKAAADVLKNTVRQGVDLPVRFGGEELAVILPHTNDQGALILAERIRAKIETLALTFEGKPVKVTISGGIAAFPTHGDDSDLVLKKADDALYRAKQGGRNRIEMAS